MKSNLSDLLRGGGASRGKTCSLALCNTCTTQTPNLLRDQSIRIGPGVGPGKPLTLPRLPCLQRFLYRTEELEGIDKPALKAEILEEITKNGEECPPPLPPARFIPCAFGIRCRISEADDAAAALIPWAELSHLYKFVCNELGWTPDAALLEKMTASNEKHLEELEAKIKDAEENLGESEVREALLAKADFLAKIGNREAAMEAYAVTEKKTVAMGQKMDLMFSILRMQIFYDDWHGVKGSIEKTKKLFEEGGDWERKNRLKVYESLYLMSTRCFKQAADRFLDSIATFTT